ncbi:MAG: type II/IV secretion system ATPase subunit [Desulfurococcales archaeon]|nr:type II/IV secretion system ATPase subunit [Desulfurococcales archaeon]
MLTRKIISRRHAERQELTRPIRQEIRVEDDRILARYKVGHVHYMIYLDEGRKPRLVFKEPREPSKDAINEIIANLREPRTPEEEYYINKKKSGYGPLYPLIIDPHIEEIAVEGPGRTIAVMHKLYPSRWIDVDMVLTSQEADSLAIQVARKARRMISIAVPYAEGITEEGHRVAISFSREISRFGSSLVIRKYPDKPVTIADLIASRVLSPLMAAYLWILVEAQSFLIIIGNMGAGKTTLLQSIAGLIPPFNRVITIEDTPELRLMNPHWDSLITRPRPPGEEIEEVDLEALLKFALRRRAEYIIVGEVRGREAKLLAQAAASGHGSMTTFHADSPEGAILRLRLDPINLPPLFLRIITGFIHVRRIPVYGGKAKRRIIAVTEVDGDELIDIFTWEPHADSFTPNKPDEVAEKSIKLEEAWKKLGAPHESVIDELDERAKLLEAAAGLTPEEFYSRIAMYYTAKMGI